MKSLRQMAHDVLHHDEKLTPENRHLNINYQRRIVRAQDEAERIIPEDFAELDELLKHLHAAGKLMTKALERKTE